MILKIEKIGFKVIKNITIKIKLVSSVQGKC